jgi:WD40 repeat protein
VNPDQELVAVSQNAGIELRSLSDNSVRQPVEAGTAGAIAYGAFSQDGETLAIAYKGNPLVFLWDTRTGTLKERTLRATSGEANVIAFSPDGQLLAGGWNNGDVLLWRVNDGKLISTLWTHDKAVACVAFSADGQVMASSGADQKIHLWQLSYEH